MKAAVVLLTLVSLALSQDKVPYACQEEKVREVCKDLVDDVINTRTIRVAGFVRLAFHDCVGTAGCNGCLNKEEGDNAGLPRYIDAALEDRYTSDGIDAYMSRADFWVLCAHEALNYAANLASTGPGATVTEDDRTNLVLNMKYGRQDCTDGPYEDAADAYPNPHNGFDTTTEYFKTEFNLTSNETIALLGAHTLGRAEANFSGFSNQWVDNEFFLDNAFYKDVLNRQLDWIKKDLNPAIDDGGKHLQYVQGANNDRNLMFSSDMCLAWNITSTKENPGSENETLPIGKSPGYDIVEIYANSNAEWFKDFSVAWEKMVTKLPTTSMTTLMQAKPDGVSSVCSTTTDPSMSTVPSSATRPSLFGLW